MTMPFGKYKGQDITDIPLDYLKWAEFTCELELYGPNLRDEINFEISRRSEDITSLGKRVK